LRPHALEAELARITASAGGRVGAAALQLETGRAVSFNGTMRLKGLLPPATPVAHETGTIEGPIGIGPRQPRVVNDVGIIELPGGAHVAIAVFIAGSPRGAEAQARVIAKIARKVYDSFS
jgi:beta-lactamase class A